MRLASVFLVLLAACGSDLSPAGGSPDGATVVLDSHLVGSWPDTSALLFPDDGSEGQDLTPFLGQQLVLNADGTFTFVGGTGTWSVGTITAADWTRWKYGPYDNQRKLVLMTSTSSLRDGPIDDLALGGVSSFDLYYHTTTPTAGWVRLSFMMSKR